MSLSTYQQNLEILLPGKVVQLMNDGEKVCHHNRQEKIMTLWREGMSRKDISIRTVVPLRTVQRVILANHNLPENSVPVRKPGSGRPKKTPEKPLTGS
jgi:hypothetical protein